MPKATTQNKAKAKTPQLVYLLSDVNIGEPTNSQSKERAFSCIANSGKPFVYFGQRTVVDLSNIKSPPVTPALVNHDRDQVAGFGACGIENNQLAMNGTLVTDDPDCKGDYVANLADKGFAWQMSAHIEASQIDEVAAGKIVTVNGQDITGPIFVLRECRVVEVSFTPTGVDYETSAVVLSATGTTTTDNPITPTQKDTPMTLEEALAEIEKMKAAETEKNNRIKALEDENAKLKASETQAQVDAQLSQAGFKKKDAGEGWESLSDGTYNMLLSADADNAKAMINDLAKTQTKDANKDDNKPPLPQVLLNEQYPATGGQGVKLSDNPLVANAQARASQSNGFI